MQDIIIDLLKNGRYEDCYKLARFMYRIAEQIMEDEDYTSLEEVVKTRNLVTDYVERNYDDDPIPMSLIEEFSLQKYIPNFAEHGSKYDTFLDSEKTLSINAVETYRDVYNYCLSTAKAVKTLSVKMNGINIKSYLTKEENESHTTLKVSRTKGRNGDSFNVTKNMSRILNQSPLLVEEGMKIVGESYVSMDAIDNGLYNPSGTQMKVSRNAALSMLRTDFRDEDYQYLRYKIFEVDGESNSNYENLMKMKDLGFDIAPIKLIQPNEIPLDTFEDFCVWLKGEMDYFYNLCIEQHMPADGLVMDVDDRNYSDNISGQYSNKNIALKFEYWSHKYYKGTVKKILTEQRSKKCSFRAQIEPLVTEDRAVARVVNIHSLSIMIKNNIKTGSDIYFKRDSGVYNNLVYGNELKELLGVDNQCLEKTTSIFQMR